MDATKRQEQPDVAAYHEAGHAVMFHSLGRPFRYVTIRSPRYRALVSRYPTDYGDYEELLLNTAGPIASIRYLNSLPERHCWPDFGTDAHVLRNINDATEEWHDLAEFRSLPYSDAERLSLWRTIESRMATLWPAVDAVAQALLNSPRRLTCREVSAIAARALEESEAVAA